MYNILYNVQYFVDSENVFKNAGVRLGYTWHIGRRLVWVTLVFSCYL